MATIRRARAMRRVGGGAEHEVAARKANDLVVRGGILGLIDEAEDAIGEEGLDELKPAARAARRAALGAQRAARVVEQILGQLRIGNPIFRLLAGVVVGVVYLVVALVYGIHKAALRRRRTARVTRSALPELRLSTVGIA